MSPLWNVFEISTRKGNRMKCPMCSMGEIKDPPWEEWYECTNCDWKPEHALRVRELEKKVKKLEKEIENYKDTISELAKCTLMGEINV